MNKEKLLEIAINTLPYPDQITDIDLNKENVIRFLWRGDRFQIDKNGYVEQVGNGILTGSNLAIIIEALFHKKG